MRWVEREASIRAALARKPNDPALEADLGVALLGQGRYVEGFHLLERWRSIPERREEGAGLPLPRWQGEDLEGKRFLIQSEHGFGDQIMYARFARILAEQGALVVWLCQPPLARLFSEALPSRGVPMEGNQTLGTFDFYALAGSLPSLFMPPLADPPSAPYLDLPPPNRIEGLNIGVVARGNPAQVNDHNRSLPEALRGELLTLPGAVSLLPEDTGARDFYDTATVLAGLDLVISVDTSIAHLAGALGKPVWIMLGVDPDWRWMEHRSDSPWYPTARLFRQPRPGDWASVLDQVREALKTRF